MRILLTILAGVLSGLLVSGCGQGSPHPKAQAGTPQAAAASPIEEVTDANFDARVLQSPVPVLVDFWAPWCGPCQTQGPIVGRIGARYAGRMKTVRVNTDDAKGVAGRYQVVAIPTLMLFKDGKVVLNRTGLTAEAELAGMIDGQL